MIDKKIQEIVTRKGFTSFWEAFDYMLLANYTELEALMIGLEIFNGDVWGKVIDAVHTSNYGMNVYSYSGSSNISFSTLTTSIRDVIMGVDTAQPDDLIVEIYLMTKEANPVYLPLYKSYIETRKYAEIEMLEKHIKSIKLTLTSEVAIALFKAGCKTKIK